MTSVNCSHYFQEPLAGGTDVPGMPPDLQGRGPCLIDLGDSGPGPSCCVNHQLWSRPGSRKRVRSDSGYPRAPGGHVFLWEYHVQPWRGNCCFSLCRCLSNFRDLLKLLKLPCQIICPADPRCPRSPRCFAWMRETPLPTA